MKTIVSIVIFLQLCTLGLYAQVYSGSVEYKASSLFEIQEIQLDSMQKVSQNKQAFEKFKEIVNNKNTITCKLEFTGYLSKFIQQEVLSSTKNIFLRAAIGKGIYFSNRKTNVITEQNDRYGDVFLISYPKLNWEIVNESKVISGFLCGKAITQVAENSATTQMKTVVAWFAFDLPFNFGPKQFNGLPGLILELEYFGRYKLTATKIVLNPEKRIEIQFPSKGIKISLKKYEEMISKSFLKSQKKYRKN